MCVCVFVFPCSFFPFPHLLLSASTFIFGCRAVVSPLQMIDLREKLTKNDLFSVVARLPTAPTAQLSENVKHMTPGSVVFGHTAAAHLSQLDKRTGLDWGGTVEFGYGRASDTRRILKTQGRHFTQDSTVESRSVFFLRFNTQIGDFRAGDL